MVTKKPPNLLLKKCRPLSCILKGLQLRLAYDRFSGEIGWCMLSDSGQGFPQGQIKLFLTNESVGSLELSGFETMDAKLGGSLSGAVEPRLSPTSADHQRSDEKATNRFRMNTPFIPILNPDRHALENPE